MTSPSNIIQFPNEAEWLAWRGDVSKGRIGGSEIAAALGHNRYESRYTFFQRKRGIIPPKSETIAMRRGKALEQLVADIYSETTGRKLTDPGRFTVYVHPQYEWLFVTPDRLVDAMDADSHDFSLLGAPVELKTKRDTAIKQWREEGPDLEHQCQHQIQMEVIEAESGSIAGLCGDQFEYFDFERNDRLIKAMLPHLKEMHERLLNDDPPEVDGSDSTTETLKAMHPNDNGQTVQLPEMALVIDEQLEELKAAAKGINAEIEAKKNWFRARIGDNTYGEYGNVKYSFASVTKKSYVVKESTFRTLRRLV